MVLSNFLSSQKNDDSNLHKIIPISFNTYKILNDKYYNIENIKYKQDLRLDQVVLNSQNFMVWERIWILI